MNLSIRPCRNYKAYTCICQIGPIIGKKSLRIALGARGNMQRTINTAVPPFEPSLSPAGADLPTMSGSEEPVPHSSIVYNI